MTGRPEEPAPEIAPAALAPESYPEPAPWPLPLLLGIALLGAAGVGTAGLVWQEPAGARETDAATAALQETNLAQIRAQLLPVDLATAAARDEVLRFIPAPEADARKMLAGAEKGTHVLGRIAVWDNRDQDGDVVTIASGGFSAQVILTSAPQTLVIPYAPGGSLIVAGVRDGGGGITVALELATGAVPLPPLQVGEVRILPLF